MSRPLEGCIEVIHEFEGYSTLWYMAKGHVDKEEFAKEVKIEFETDFTVDQVEHRYAHNRPVGPGYEGTIIDLVKGPGRGSYPVTIIDIERWF